MAERQTDPARLQGEALRRWYTRSPADVEQEQQNRYDQRHREFFGAPAANGSNLAALSSPDQKRTAALSKSGNNGSRSPVDVVQDALHDFQDGPKMQRPNLAQSFIPVVGPAWEAAADLQDGNYGGAAFNTAMAVGDALPVGAIFKGARAATKGIGVLTNGSVSAGAAATKIRKAGRGGEG